VRQSLEHARGRKHANFVESTCPAGGQASGEVVIAAAASASAATAAAAADRSTDRATHISASSKIPSR